LASAFAADSFADRLTDFIIKTTSFTNQAAVNNTAVILITIILSYVTLVFGELVPKRIGMQKSESIALAVGGTVRLVGRIMSPFVFVLNRSTNGILRLFGYDPNAEPSDVTEEEIRMMVDIGEEKGSIEANEKKLITNVFEFNNKEAADVMTHRTDISMIWIDDDEEEVKKEIMTSGYSRYPVYDEDADDIVGVLHIRDYFSNMMQETPKTMKELIRPAYFIPEQVPTDALFRDMQQQKIHMAVVLDEYGGTRGVVTMEDLLEEIVGNIYDEYDEAPEVIQQVDDHTWRVPGSIELEQLEELFKTQLPKDDLDTLGGLVFSQLRSIPEDGSQPIVEAYGLRVQVQEILDRRVEWALVSLVRDELASHGEEPDLVLANGKSDRNKNDRDNDDHGSGGDVYHSMLHA
jgi:putative hemolysin